MKKSNSLEWYKLDNAAKLFAAVSTEKDTNVFRIACQLKENVDAKLLQMALDKTIEDFPSFCLRLKRGLFWYFLEHNPNRLLVEKENKYPCAFIDYKKGTGHLFRVSYYEKRINIEVFHVLSDGTGTLAFLKKLIYNYLKLVHPKRLAKASPPIDSEISPFVQTEDSFTRYYDSSRKNSIFQKKAYHVTGQKFQFNELKVTQCIVSVKALLQMVKAQGFSITGYLAALIMYSIYKADMPARKRNKAIKIVIPVDLRKHFQSDSVRNFFACITAKYVFSEDTSFEQVVESVTLQIKEQLNKNTLSSTISLNVATERNFFVRFVPLFFKNLILKQAYIHGESYSTTAMSNLGNISLSKELNAYIDHFEVFLPPTTNHAIKFALCSFEDEFFISFSSHLNSKIPQFFFSFLAQQGLDVTIIGNEV